MATYLGLQGFAGQRVRRFAAGRLPAGEHARAWDLSDDHGRRVGPGVYFVRLRTAGGTAVRKLFVAP